MIKVSIEVQKFVLELANIFYAQIVSKIVGPFKSQYSMRTNRHTDKRIIPFDRGCPNLSDGVPEWGHRYAFANKRRKFPKNPSINHASKV